MLAVSDAGLRGDASKAMTGRSAPSVTGTGSPVATVGEFDGKTCDFQFAPNQYRQIPTTYPDGVIDYVDGQDTPGAAWPYLLPGPGDAWAGNKTYAVQWHFELPAAAADDHDLAVWLVDTTRLGGTLEVNLNGAGLRELDLPQGGTRGSLEGDATLPGSTLLRSYHEFTVPAADLQAGTNTIEFVQTAGGWLACGRIFRALTRVVSHRLSAGVFDQAGQSFFGDGADMLGDHGAVPVQNDGDGQSGRASVGQQFAFEVDDLGVRSVHFLEERAGAFRIVLGVHAEELHPITLAGVGCLKNRHFLAAGTAPRRPQVDHHRAPQPAQIHRWSVDQAGESDVGEPIFR